MDAKGLGGGGLDPDSFRVSSAAKSSHRNVLERKKTGSCLWLWLWLGEEEPIPLVSSYFFSFFLYIPLSLGRGISPGLLKDSLKGEQVHAEGNFLLRTFTELH